LSKKKRVTLTDLFNDLTFNNIYNKYKLMALNRFEWVNLPDGIKSKHIEQYLFEEGKAVFFKDPNMSFMCLRTNAGGHRNVYGEPLTWWAKGFQYNKEYKADDVVVIDNNPLRLPTHDFVMMYAYKIAEAERTMDVNMKANKTPFIFTCDDKDVWSFKQIFEKVDGNVPAIYCDKGLNLDSINVLQTGVKFLCNEIRDHINGVESELLTFLGFNNVNVDKKERLITDEAESNDELIGAFLDLQYHSRLIARDQIRELFGLPDIDVVIRGECKHESEVTPNDV